MWKDCFVPNAILRKIWETTRNLGTHPAWLLETTISKICHFPTRLSPSKTQNFVIVAIYQLATWNFFRLVIQLMFFWRLVEPVQLLLLLLVVLLCYCQIMLYALDILCPWAMVSIRRLLQMSRPHPFPQPGFHQFCLLFCKKDSINLLALI